MVDTPRVGMSRAFHAYVSAHFGICTNSTTVEIPQAPFSYYPP